MNCPDCEQPCQPQGCQLCGWKAKVKTTSVIDAFHLSQRKPLRSVQCGYRTGTWQCRWGKLTREPHDLIYCDFHREVLRHGMDRTVDVYEFFKTECEFYLKVYPKSSFVVLGDDLESVKQIPFWYQSFERQWYALTGLPVPVEATVGADE